jgi:hypothetical protein
LKFDASFDVDPKGIFDRKIVALPGPWSINRIKKGARRAGRHSMTGTPELSR